MIDSHHNCNDINFFVFLFWSLPILSPKDKLQADRGCVPLCWPIGRLFINIQQILMNLTNNYGMPTTCQGLHSVMRTAVGNKT